MTGELRLYTFCNFYLSSFQQGWQSGHLISKLFVKYEKSKPQLPDLEYHKTRERFENARQMLWTWAQYYETGIVLNGGDAQDIAELAYFFTSRDNPYPWASFHESNRALGGVITVTGIILPEKFFPEENNAPASVEELLKQYTPWEMELVTRKSKCGLAR